MYNKEDFENLFWNPHGNPKDVRKLWNTLNLYKEFQESLPVKEDLFFNYMEMVYHKQSVMVKDFENIKDRKVKAMEILLSKNSKDFNNDVISIIDGKNSSANRMAIRFCTLQQSQEYSLLMVSSISYDRMLFKMQQDSESQDVVEAVAVTEKTQKQLHDMLKRISEMKRQIFMSDKNLESEADDDFLSHARVEGFTELVVRKKIKITKP
jgi:hypothetical protein